MLFDDIGSCTVAAHLAGAGTIDWIVEAALPGAADNADIVVSFAALDKEAVRRKFNIRRDLVKIGDTISCTEGELQMWKCTGGLDEQR